MFQQNKRIFRLGGLCPHKVIRVCKRHTQMYMCLYACVYRPGILSPKASTLSHEPRNLGRFLTKLGGFFGRLLQV